ncbi:MAG: hypothetical protein GX785_13940 [Armatimonadetes bacterium]|nr:hypothetical protein [Armatimonadota bacterium]
MRDVNAASRAKRVRGHRSVALLGMRELLAACATVLCAVLFLPHGVAAQEPARPRIAFVDLALPDEGKPRESGALAFARRQGEVIRVKPLATGGWQDDSGRLRAPEEADLVWYHSGEVDAAARFGRAGAADLLAYLEAGGSVLLTGTAGSLLNAMGIETAPLRVSTQKARQGSLRVVEKHRAHPVFAGLPTSTPIVLPTRPGSAVAGLDVPSGSAGELLADAMPGSGEGLIVEYTAGAGRVIFVGGAVPDFTAAPASHQESLFSNVLRYLAARSTNHARLVTPPGAHHYERLFGVPFLRAEKPVILTAPANGARYAALLTDDRIGDGFRAGRFTVRETPVRAEVISAQALGLTLVTREKPVSGHFAAQREQQKAFERRDHEMTRGLRVIRPTVTLAPAPLKPLVTPEADRSVLLGRSPYKAPGRGRGAVAPLYEPVEEGGFRVVGGTRRFNRPIVHGLNRVCTGDVPLFRMETVAGKPGDAPGEGLFPLWPRPDAGQGAANPCLGTLRLGVPGAGEGIQWLDTLPGTVTTFWPGYTEYRVAHPDAGWTATVTVAPLLETNGLICRVEFDREVALAWQYGGIWWAETEANRNRVTLEGATARITEANLPNGLVFAGWDGEGEGQKRQAAYGEQVEFVAEQARRAYHIVATWGVTEYDAARAEKLMARLDTPAAAGWTWARDILKRRWFDCYIGRALKPELRLRAALLAPEAELRRISEFWDSRRTEFQVKTPDAHLNALVNWARGASEYHRQGPGLADSALGAPEYASLSTGWQGKAWAGDHQALEECLRLYAAFQDEDGFIPWVTPSLVPWRVGNNTPYWVIQVWEQYAWTGDRQFVRELWPQVRKAVAWQCRQNDPDGDGLFREAHDYWNLAPGWKGSPVVASVVSWAMLDRAARMAGVVGDAAAETEYRRLAEISRQAILGLLWREDAGRLGALGADGLWHGHPQTRDEFLAVNLGLLDMAQGRRAMRWLEAHYGFEPVSGVRLLATSDWWPLRWVAQWVPNGETCLAALAGLRCGDADLWWPYVKTAVLSSLRSEFPGIHSGITDAGAGSGDRERASDIDPLVHMAARGLFGIEPAVHEGWVAICPAFPSDWTEASIRTPVVSYEYRREGSQAVFHIRSPKPLVKRVRAYPGGREVVTPAETESVVTVPLAAVPPLPAAGPRPQLLVEHPGALDGEEPAAGPKVAAALAPSQVPLTEAERARQILFDLSGAANVTLEEMTAMRFQFEGGEGLASLSSGWGNPPLAMRPSPRVLEVSNGVRFLTGGRIPRSLGYTPKNLLALSSWAPYPLPAGATIQVMRRCERLWLLLQSYVHPTKNYVPNGEVVLRYADGTRKILSLVPPYNLDCYFQHFSLDGMPVPFGYLGAEPAGRTPLYPERTRAHADVLAIESDPTRLLEAVELRATCSEGILGLAGMTALAAEDEPSAGLAAGQSPSR